MSLLIHNPDAPGAGRLGGITADLDFDDIDMTFPPVVPVEDDPRFIVMPDYKRPTVEHVAAGELVPSIAPEEYVARIIGRQAVAPAVRPSLAAVGYVTPSERTVPLHGERHAA